MIWILLFIAAAAISWIFTYAILAVIFFCFGLTLTLKIATGIWLCLFLLGSVFGGSKKK